MFFFVFLGTIFDVSGKADVYGPGKSYSIFAGKDGSRGLGLSSLKADDAIADYRGLEEKEMKVLDDWHSFFTYVFFFFFFLAAFFKCWALKLIFLVQQKKGNGTISLAKLSMAMDSFLSMIIYNTSSTAA